MSNTNQVSHEEALAVAQQHHQAGNLTLADITYRDILKVIPNDFKSLHYLAIIAYQRGNPEEGLEFIERAIAVQDDRADSWNAYGVMLAETGDHKEAVEKFKKALEIDKNYLDALSNLGNSQWQLNEYEAAIESCERAIKINPDYVNGHINLGGAYTSVKEHQKALEVWQKALELDPHHPLAHMNICNVLRELGRINEAEDYGQKAIELAPHNAIGFVNLGNAKRDLGKFEEAENLYRQATQIQPDYIDGHNNLAILMMDMLRFNEAITASRYAIAFDPHHAQAHSNLAAALLETGQLEQAELAARKAIVLNPDLVEAQIDLADVLYMSDRFDEAETLFNKAMEETPDSPRLYLKLSAVLEKANRIDEALECIDKAVEISPESPEVYHRQAMTYYMAGRIQDSIKALDKALELNPEFSHALASKSEVLQSEGKMKEAEKFVRQALEIDNTIPFLYYTLGKIKKFTEDDPDFIQMQKVAAAGPKHGLAQQTSLEFALFGAYENIKDYKNAFTHLKQANDLKRKTVLYNSSAEKTAYETVKATYTKEKIESFDGLGCEDDTPIFIVGMPRSGTTLTEQIIASHPDVFGAGELLDLARVEKELGKASPDNCKALGEKYIEYIRSISDEAESAKKITDKMPGNYTRIGQIITTLPNAKIIHCRRNPIDTCLSCYKQLFARGQYWSYNLEELALHYKLYEDMMAHWRAIVPERFIEIDYEDTVNDFENQARRLIDYVGLGWNDSCLTPHKSKRAIMTASKGQVRKPIYKTSIEAWRRYEEELQPLAKALDEFVRK